MEDVREKIMAYCIAKYHVLEKWRQKYAAAQNMDASLPSFPSLPSQTWLLEVMLAATSVGKFVNFEEMDYAYGCDWHVSSTNYSIFTPITHCYMYAQT